MKASEKLKSDLARGLAGLSAPKGALGQGLAGGFAAQALSFLPQSMLPLVSEAFEARRAADPEKASAWLLGVAGIFTADYDGGLEEGDWGQLKSFVQAGSGELDMEVLTYALNLVMEHKAL